MQKLKSNAPMAAETSDFSPLYHKNNSATFDHNDELDHDISQSSYSSEHFYKRNKVADGKNSQLSKKQDTTSKQNTEVNILNYMYIEVKIPFELRF